MFNVQKVVDKKVAVVNNNFMFKVFILLIFVYIEVIVYIVLGVKINYIKLIFGMMLRQEEMNYLGKENNVSMSFGLDVFV